LAQTELAPIFPDLLAHFPDAERKLLDKSALEAPF
jgi:hypothetical protein